MNCLAKRQDMPLNNSGLTMFYGGGGELNPDVAHADSIVLMLVNYCSDPSEL